MNQNTYIVDIQRLGRDLVPVEARKAWVLAFVRILVIPFAVVLGNIIRLRNNSLYELSITPQVYSLEKYLNDRYDYSLRRIYITDGVQRMQLFIYNRSEDQPLYVNERTGFKKYIRSRIENSNQLNEFIVKVPAIQMSINEATGLLRKKVLPGTAFKFEPI